MPPHNRGRWPSITRIIGHYSALARDPDTSIAKLIIASVTIIVIVALVVASTIAGAVLVARFSLR